MAMTGAPGGITPTTSPFKLPKPKAAGITPVAKPVTATETAGQVPKVLGSTTGNQASGYMDNRMGLPQMVAPAYPAGSKLAGSTGSRTDINSDGKNDVTGAPLSGSPLTATPGAIHPIGSGMFPSPIQPVPNGVQPIGPGMNPTGITPGPGPQPVGPGMFPTQAAPPTLEQTLYNQYQGTALSPRLAGTQGMVDQAAQNLSTGPDRTQLAQQAFKDYLSQSNDQFGKDIRAITQRAAAGGRLGSGMYGSDLVDAATAADKNRAYAGNQLAQDLANGTISDRFNTLSVLGGLEGQQFGQGQTALNNYLGYGQQAFQNQLATQQMQQNLSNDQFQQYLALLGLQG